MTPIEVARELQDSPAPRELRGVYRCGKCGWAGVPVRHKGKIVNKCPACEIAPETDALYEAMQAAPSGKIGRNDPCPCDSGKKYKKCCGR